jgi:hypothetical protein
LDRHQVLLLRASSAAAVSSSSRSLAAASTAAADHQHDENQQQQQEVLLLSTVEALLLLSPRTGRTTTGGEAAVAVVQPRLPALPEEEEETLASSRIAAAAGEHQDPDMKVGVSRAAGTVSPFEEDDDDDDDESSVAEEDLAPPAGATSTSSTSRSCVTYYYEGSCDLACPEDEECLSPLHCFTRKYCVEAFTAQAGDIATPLFGRNWGRRIAVGQVSAFYSLFTTWFIVDRCVCVVLTMISISFFTPLLLLWPQIGIQCKWCKHRHYKDRPERAVCFPSTMKNIYHSIETWQRRHATVCTGIPPWAKTQMIYLMKGSHRGAGGRRCYWEESAKRLGMVDTDNGVRFIRPPGTIDPPPQQQLSLSSDRGDHMDVDDSGIGNGGNGTGGTTVSSSHPIVRNDDSQLFVTGYLFCLLEQMESCYFSDEDRIGGRSKVKSCQLGYPGYVFMLECEMNAILLTLSQH